MEYGSTNCAAARRLPKILKTLDTKALDSTTSFKNAQHFECIITNNTFFHFYFCCVTVHYAIFFILNVLE